MRSLKLKVLLDICQSIDQALQLDIALPDILRTLSERLSMKRATVSLVDASTGRLSIRASHGLTSEEKKRGVYRLDEGVTGLIFQTAKPYVVPDIRKEPLFLDKTGARKVEKGRISFLGVPILLHTTPIGVLNVDRLFADEISWEEDVDFLQIVATLIAQFISLNNQFNESMEHLRRENVSLKYQLSKKAQRLYIVGKSQSMLDIQRQFEKVAPTRATVLLLGESGTGKTLIAKIVHELSERKQYPFVKVNCAAIPENLLESELFGYEKGAFTSASSSKAGRFEDADKGTIFLDEIGEIPLGLQAKLLRVLQDREFERLGSNTTRKVDVRIIAATNKNLASQVEHGRFRSDLYYRLNVFPIDVPPLRDRKEDITSLLIHFLDKVSREYNRSLTFSPEALKLLKEYNWPGNVREMENLVERLVILTEKGRIDRETILPYIAPAQESEEPKLNGRLRRNPSLQEVEKGEVIAALRRNLWIQQRAANDLGITMRQLGYRIKKYNLATMVSLERARIREARQAGA